MSKRQKKKAPIVEEESEVEVITRVEYTYEDTRCTIGIEPEYKWGEIYRLISHHEVPDTGFEEETIYAKIERLALMKIATRPELFPCLEVIGWILPMVDVTTMIMENTDKQGYAAYNPGYVSLAYHLPESQVYLTKDWLKEINIDLIETLKIMLVPGKSFRTTPSGEYDTTTLRTPYRFIALMLYRIFGRAHSKSFKLGWVPIIFCVATQGTVFNWANIVSNSLSACIASALGGVS